MTNPMLFQISMAIYLLSSILYFLYLATKNETLAKVGSWTALSGFTTNIAALVVRYIESYQLGIGYAPLSNMYESMVFFASAIVGFHLLFERIYRTRMLGPFIMPLGFFAVGIAVLTLSPDIKPLIPALQSDWLSYHVVACFTGYASFALSFGVSVLYLAKKTAENSNSLFPNRKTLEDMNYKAITVGFLLFTVGIITGAIWAHYAWGSYWSWDPKETRSMITWIVYAILLHTRYKGRMAGRKMAYISVVGFAAVLFTYWGVNYLLPGLHSYA
jgi:cytochrome c-type biogenesis protein CcsB